MPKCSNDTTKSYKGDEPSPLGLGFASSPLEVGTVMKGRDGSDWIVGETQTGVKRWKKVSVKKEKASKDNTSDEDEPPTEKKKTTKKEKSAEEDESLTKKKKTSKKEKSTEEDEPPTEKKKTSKKEKSTEEDEPSTEKKKTSKKDETPTKKKNTSKKEKSTEKDETPKEKKKTSKKDEPKKKNSEKKIDSDEEESDKEFDFDDLDNRFYRDVYYPKFKKIDENDKNSGLMEKFGGNVPFFIKGEEWPTFTLEGEQIPFFCQVKDPKNKDILYRVFLLSEDEYFINKIELSEENMKNQITIEKDASSSVTYPAFKVDWVNSRELRDYEFIINEFKMKDTSEIYDLYHSSRYSPSHHIKIGGTPVFTQYRENIDAMDNFLQLSDMYEAPFSWGDSGIAHIKRDCELEWDCC